MQYEKAKARARNKKGLQAQLARLAARGCVTLPTREPLRRVRLVRVSGAPISKTILEDRR